MTCFISQNRRDTIRWTSSPLGSSVNSFIQVKAGVPFIDSGSRRGGSGGGRDGSVLVLCGKAVNPQIQLPGQEGFHRGASSPRPEQTCSAMHPPDKETQPRLLFHGPAKAARAGEPSKSKERPFPHAQKEVNVLFVFPLETESGRKATP